MSRGVFTAQKVFQLGTRFRDKVHPRFIARFSQLVVDRPGNVCNACVWPVLLLREVFLVEWKDFKKVFRHAFTRHRIARAVVFALGGCLFFVGQSGGLYDLAFLLKASRSWPLSSNRFRMNSISFFTWSGSEQRR